MLLIDSYKTPPDPKILWCKLPFPGNLLSWHANTYGFPFFHGGFEKFDVRRELLDGVGKLQL